MRMRISLSHHSKVTKMEVIMIIMLATIVSVPRRTLLLRCGDVELNPGPVGRYPDLDYDNIDNSHILGEEDIGDILKEIIHVKANYNAFGIILGLSYAQLESIQKTPLCIVDIGAALTEVVLTWLRQKYNTARFGLPTWRKLVEAVDSEAGGNNHSLAKEIASRHPVITDQNSVAGPVSRPARLNTPVTVLSPMLETRCHDYGGRRSRPVSPVCGFGGSEMQLTSTSEDPFDTCQRLLSTCYLEQTEEGEETNWPPVKATMFVPFTMIKHEKLKQQTSGFVTVRQQVDSTLVGEARIEYSDLIHELQSKSGIRIIIEGRPGSGKTTLVIEISKDWAKGEILQSKLFFLVRLKMLHDLEEKLTLFSMISTLFEDLSASGILESLCSCITLQSGEGVVFALDGLDEYSPKSKDDFIHKLITKHTLPKSTVLIMSRPAGTQAYRRNASLLIEVIGFTGAQIPEYVYRYFADDTQKAQKLIAHLEQHRNLMNTCYSPLHLNMLVFLYEEDIELPATETQMYLHFTLSVLLRSIYKRKDSQSTVFLNSYDDLSPEDKSLFDKICKFAFDATVSMKQSFKSSELSDKMIFKPGAKGSDEDTLGLVVVDRQVALRGRQEVYSFFHLTFQEYLAAVYITGLDPSHQQQLIKKYRRDSPFTLMWRFVCGTLDYSIETSIVIFTHILYYQASMNTMTKLYFAYESQQGKCCACLINNGTLRLPSKEQFTISDCTAIGYVVNSAASLNPDQQIAIDFDKSHFSVEGVVAFLQQVIDIQLDLMISGSKTTTTFLKGLKSCPVNNMHRIKIFHAKLGVDEIQNFIAGLRSCSNLHEIVLFDSNIGVSGMSILGEGLKHCRNLQVLNLDSNNLDKEGVEILGRGLVHCSTLQSINLSHNKIGDAGAKHLAKFFICDNCRQLKILSLEKVSLGDDGLSSLMQGLKCHSNIQELNVRKNNIGASGVQTLVDSPVFAHLQVINLRENKLGDVGVKILVEGVINLKCSNLITLDLLSNSITDEGLMHLRKLIVTVHSLKNLDIRANLFTEYEKLREAKENRTEEMAKLHIEA